MIYVFVCYIYIAIPIQLPYNKNSYIETFQIYTNPYQIKNTHRESRYIGIYNWFNIIWNKCIGIFICSKKEKKKKITKREYWMDILLWFIWNRSIKSGIFSIIFLKQNINIERYYMKHVMEEHVHNESIYKIDAIFHWYV